MSDSTATASAAFSKRPEAKLAGDLCRTVLAVFEHRDNPLDAGTMRVYLEGGLTCSCRAFQNPPTKRKRVPWCIHLTELIMSEADVAPNRLISWQAWDDSGNPYMDSKIARTAMNRIYVPLNPETGLGVICRPQPTSQQAEGEHAFYSEWDGGVVPWIASDHLMIGVDPSTPFTKVDGSEGGIGLNLGPGPFFASRKMLRSMVYNSIDELLLALPDSPDLIWPSCHSEWHGAWARDRSSAHWLIGVDAKLNINPPTRVDNPRRTRVYLDQTYVELFSLLRYGACTLCCSMNDDLVDWT